MIISTIKLPERNFECLKLNFLNPFLSTEFTARLLLLHNSESSMFSSSLFFLKKNMWTCIKKNFTLSISKTISDGCSSEIFVQIWYVGWKSTKYGIFLCTSVYLTHFHFFLSVELKVKNARPKSETLHFHMNLFYGEFLVRMFTDKYQSQWICWLKQCFLRFACNLHSSKFLN